MSLAIAQTGLAHSRTWRQFQTACGCVALTLAVGCLLYAVETLILRCPHRFVENPADTMTRAIGLAHFSIGWLFLFTSPRLRNRSTLVRLAIWTALGVGFCWLFERCGADRNPLVMLAFYSFFFIHEVRDEANLFRHSGELAVPDGLVERFLPTLCATMALLLMACLAGLQMVRGHWLGRSAALVQIPAPVLLAAWLILGTAAALAASRTITIARRLFGSARHAADLFRPLLAVYAGIASILLVGSLFGSVGANLIILIHGLTWLVYTHRKLSENPIQATGPWSWLRATPRGFLTLHLLAISAALMLFALRTHLWQRTGLVCHLVSKTWFPYWSLMHIAMAFARSR